MEQEDAKSRLPKVIAAALAFLSIFAGPPWVAASEILLLDTFDDDAAGQPPNGPEVGSYLELSGSHVVIDASFSDLALLTSDDAINSGPVLRYGPASSSNSYTIEFDLRFSSSTIPVGQDAFSQTLDFNEQAVEIRWADNGQVYLSVRFFAGLTTYETPFQWGSDVDYSVSVDVDSLSNNLDFTVNAFPILEGLQLPEEVGELRSLDFRVNEPTVGAQTLDNVRIVAGSLVFRDGFESGDLGAWQ